VLRPDDRRFRRQPLLLLLLLLRELPLLMGEKLVLFICVENAGRSLMAEAVFNAHPAPGWVAASAGTRPAPAPHPRTRTMLNEIGLDLPNHPPHLLSPDLLERARLRVTMGCLDDASCPAHLKTLELQDWHLDDPAQLDDEGFRHVRDLIADRIRELRSELVLADRGATQPASTARR
jgi:arsenate reductase